MRIAFPDGAFPTIPPVGVVALLAIAGFWTICAIWVTVAGIRRQRGGAREPDRAPRWSALLASMPAIPIIVSADGQIQTSDRIADWLGLPQRPSFLSELSGNQTGIPAEDLALLKEHVAAARSLAADFTQVANIASSDRRLTIMGRPLNASVAGPGGVILWLFDSSEVSRRVEQLTLEGERLRTALDALASLIEAAPIPMWHRGSDLRLSLVNSAYVRAVEAESAGQVISGGLELVEANVGRNPLASAATARETGQVQSRNAPATISGQRRMLRIVDVPLGEAGVAGYAVDVEELEQARGDLTRFASAQRDMLDRLSAGVAQFGPDHNLVFSNQAFRRLFAMKAEWLADRPEFDRVLERMREAGRLPESYDFRGWKAERRAWFTTPSGAIEENWLLPGGLHLRVVAQPLPDGGLLVIFEDRTEQIQLASARDTLLRVRTATFDNLFEALAVFASDGRLYIWNNRFREVWGLEEAVLATHPRVDALVDTVARRLTNPARAGLIRELVRIATVDRQQRSGHVQMADGRHFAFAAVPLPDGNALFTMLDVTDSHRIEIALRQANDALGEADRIKSAFMANMSRELRTPLTSIGGFAEMLSGGYAGELTPDQTEYVRAINDSVDRLSALIDDALEQTHSQIGDLPMPAEPIELGPLAHDALAAVRDRAEAQGVSVEVRADARAGTLVGDRRRLGQAIEALIDRALATTASGGRIVVRVTGTALAGEIILSGTGQSAGKAAESGGEAAFATSLVRQVVEGHGGTVDYAATVGDDVAVVVQIPRRQSRDDADE
ncbi:PAS-domain containing protein [Sphingomonas sp. ID0503]|uniref:sensor histidine kinase n=1 Tax=Sphingomonas sp. ID0503 TaxID=3399691 RepID=UPI003AFB2D98